MEIALTEYSKFFIVMLALVDPVTIIPIYGQMTLSLSRVEKKRLARRAALATTIALITALFFGETILRIFGISLASFRIAGGLLLLVMAMQLMYQPSMQRNRKSGEIDIEPLESQVVVPLAIPLLAGPGAFSTVIVYSFRQDTWQHYAALSLCLLLLGLIVWISLHLAGPFLKHLSQTSVAIVCKLMGLIVAAISVEFIANGIKELAAQ